MDLQRRASALRRRLVGSVGDHARLRVQARHRRRPRRRRVVDLRRQDHDVSEARRARARRARAVPAADEAALDRARRRFPAATCLPEGWPSWIAELIRALSGAPGRAVARPRAPARHARAVDPGRREDARRSGRGLRPGSHRGRDRLSRATRSGRAAATTCSGGGPSAVSACPQAESRSRRRRTSPKRSREPRDTAAMQPLASDAGRRAPRDPRRADRHRRHAVDARPTRPREAYAAMERLRAAGKLVIPITGRPAGWCDHIARMWPVDAVVGENGALYMRYDAARAQARAALRRRRADATRAIASGSRPSRDKILAAVPGSALASDQRYRETDLAIDFCEDVPPLPRAAIDRIVAMMEAEGMTAKVSSIHVNGWFGTLRQADDDEARCSHEVFGDRRRGGARAVRLRRRFAERRADVRVLSRTPSAWRTCATSPIASRRCRRTSRAPKRAPDSRSSRISCWRSQSALGCRQRTSRALQRCASAARPAIARARAQCFLDPQRLRSISPSARSARTSRP